jgi:hypothetical protein|tara:strand:+ start:2762 stop:3157 length:396 start_codon:yes stop_codon:yes gene_type:complete
MSDLNQQLLQYYKTLDPSDQQEILKKTLELTKQSKSADQLLTFGDASTPTMTESVGNVFSKDPRTNQILEEAAGIGKIGRENRVDEFLGKAGGTLKDFQGAALDSRRGDRGLGYTAVVTDLLKNLALINKL